MKRFFWTVVNQDGKWATVTPHLYEKKVTALSWASFYNDHPSYPCGAHKALRVEVKQPNAPAPARG